MRVEVVVKKDKSEAMATFYEDDKFVGEFFLQDPKPKDLKKEHLIELFVRMNKGKTKKGEGEVTTDDPGWSRPSHGGERHKPKEDDMELIDEILKDWCADADGKWITVRGKHICIGGDKLIAGGMKERTIIGPGRHKAKIIYDPEKRDVDLKTATQSYTYLPEHLKRRINKIEIYNTPQSFKEVFGENVPEYYRKYSKQRVSGWWDKATSTLRVNADGNIGTLHHEMGHAIEPYPWLPGGRARNPDYDNWENVWKSEKTSKYSAVTKSEGFAEAYKFYRHNPEVMKDRNPKTFEFMEEYLHGED